MGKWLRFIYALSSNGLRVCPDQIPKPLLFHTREKHVPFGMEMQSYCEAGAKAPSLAHENGKNEISGSIGKRLQAFSENMENAPKA